MGAIWVTSSERKGKATWRLLLNTLPNFYERFRDMWRKRRMLHSPLEARNLGDLKGLSAMYHINILQDSFVCFLSVV